MSLFINDAKSSRKCICPQPRLSLTLHRYNMEREWCLTHGVYSTHIQRLTDRMRNLASKQQQQQKHITAAAAFSNNADSFDNVVIMYMYMFLVNRPSCQSTPADHRITECFR